jgi:hypothetical protein
MLVATYRLLTEVASGLERPVCVSAWEHPWIRTLKTPDGGRPRRVRLPAAATLINGEAVSEPEHRLLLLPDLGTAPLTSYKPALRGLIELRRAADPDNYEEPLLIVGVATPSGSSARAAAWRSCLQQVARRAGDRPPRARVLVCEKGLVGGRDRERRLGGQAEEVFALLARHPLLTREQLATLLGTSTARVARLGVQLMDRGWVRIFPLEHQPDIAAGYPGDSNRRLRLVQLTRKGVQEASRRLLLSAALARRQHGVMDGDAMTRRFLRQIQHTLGANAFFVDLAAAGMRVTAGGGDEALIEWRSAAACARGRFRPDGYGCYRRGSARFGFFLEFDRGTERPGQYAAKLAAYYRYRNTGAFRRDYETFPTVLLVTTSAVAEARFADQASLVADAHAGAPLKVLLTTSSRIQGHPEGVLGPVWRKPGLPRSARDCARGYWLPGGPPRSLLGREQSSATTSGLTDAATKREV